MRSASAPSLGTSCHLVFQNGRASHVAFNAQAGLKDISEAPSRASLPGGRQPLLIVMQLRPRAAAVQDVHICTPATLTVLAFQLISGEACHRCKDQPLGKPVQHRAWTRKARFCQQLGGRRYHHPSQLSWHCRGEGPHCLVLTLAMA